MEFLQAFITLTVFGGGFFYLLNRIHRLDKSFNAHDIQTATLQSILLSINELNGSKKVSEKETQNAETAVPSSLSTKKSRKNTRNKHSLEPELSASEQKQILRKSKREEVPQKNQDPQKVKMLAEIVEPLLDQRKRPRTEEQKRLMSERRKAWWEKKRMEKAKLDLPSDTILKPAMREVSMV